VAGELPDAILKPPFVPRWSFGDPCGGFRFHSGDMWCDNMEMNSADRDTQFGDKTEPTEQSCSAEIE